MRSWTTSPGYPLVSVSSAANNRIVLSARPYTPALYSSIVQAPVWWIPVTCTVSVDGIPSPITIRTSFMSNAQVYRNACKLHLAISAHACPCSASSLFLEK